MCVHRKWEKHIQGLELQGMEHKTRSYTDNQEIIKNHKEVLEHLEYIWGCYPEFMLGQLLCYIAVEVLGTTDPFYLDDSKYQTFRDTVADRYKDL